jgi:flagellar hook protein FlgE
MASFYIPLSGLNADSTALNTIANNLSNMNTTGYKEQTTNFSDLFYQQVGTTGSGDEIQQGTGVQVASNSTDFTGGSISSTGIETDAAIDGSGFFVLDAGSGKQLYTRDGNFQVSSTGTLESTEGQAVMGYLATNGVVDTNSGLADLTIPTGQVMQPSSTTSFSMTQNLDSAAPVGATATGQVQVYDSLGKSYEATVTYTNLGDNKWSYAVTLPDTLKGATSSAAGTTTIAVAPPTSTSTPVTADTTTVTGVATTITSNLTSSASVASDTNTLTAASAASVGASTLTSSAAASTAVTASALAAASGSIAANTTYNFTSSDGSVATVNSASNLTITGVNALGASTTTALPAFSGAPETVGDYATDLTSALTAAGIVGVTVTGSNATGVLNITGATAINGSVSQDFTGSKYDYTFNSSGTVDPSSSLTISGPNADGVTKTIVAPVFASGESVSNYAQALNTALTTAGITGVTASSNSNVLSITGPTTISFGGSLTQDVPETTLSYNFGPTGTVDPATALTITGGTSSGGTATITAPTVTSGESVAAYATALTGELAKAGINDVSVSSTAGGVLSILGNTATLATSGAVKDDVSETTLSYAFGSSSDTLATVDPATNLTITGPTATGGTATITAPTVTAGETVGAYATALTGALATADITGVTASVSDGKLSIVGSGIKTSGSVSQDLAGTLNTYTFQPNATMDSSTNLVITGQNSNGSQISITAPTVSSGETLTEYATALTNALSTAGVTNVTATVAGNTLSITGANYSTSGSINQSLADTTTTFNFGSNATVGTATDLSITGLTASGTPETVTASVTAGESVSDYASALNFALSTAGIVTGTDGVTVTATDGSLSIVGPTASTSVLGSATQDLPASTTSTISYNFGTSEGTTATVDPSTNLTITGLTSEGNSATTTAPAITAGETLAQYASALNSALSAAGIAGVNVSSTSSGVLSITGANVTTSGSVVQDPVASSNASGTLTFNSNGNLVSPTTNVSNITFSGLSDNATPMNMAWGLYSATGGGEISQTASSSTQSAQTQNGYTSGEYQSFTIGSNGTITASYSNGQNQTVGQVGLALVSNLQGLSNVGSTEYQTTTASGLATVGVAGSGSLGTLEGSSLEASNVNISDEFSDLIIAQRAFEANSKAVTTFDTITQETINMIH